MLNLVVDRQQGRERNKHDVENGREQALEENRISDDRTESAPFASEVPRCAIVDARAGKQVEVRGNEKCERVRSEVGGSCSTGDVGQRRKADELAHQAAENESAKTADHCLEAVFAALGWWGAR